MTKDFAFWSFFALVSLTAITAPSLFGQELPDVAQGIQPYTVYRGGELDSINTANGSLTVRIPLVSYPQKGTLSLSYSVIFNSYGYEDAAYCDSPPDPNGPIDVIPLNNNCTNTVQLIPVGLNQFIPPGPLLIADQILTAGGISAPDPYTSFHPPIYGGFQVVSADNAEHPIGLASDGTYRSIDQSGYLFSPSNPPSYPGNLGTLENAYPGDQTVLISQAPGTITDSKGNVYTSTSITDRNGNSITIPSGNTASAPFMGLPATDSTGHNIPNPASGSIANCPSIPGAPAATSARSWTPPGAGSGYLFCFAPVTIQTSFLIQHNGANNDLNETESILQSIVLPTTPSTYWGFIYDSYVQGQKTTGLGQLTKLIYPTGGYVEYIYAFVNGPCDNVRVSGLVAGSMITVIPTVKSRTEYDADGTLIGTWSYTYPRPFDTGWLGSILSPSGDMTITKFVNNSTGSQCGFLDAGQDVYQGDPVTSFYPITIQAGAKPLRSTSISYYGYPVEGNPPYIGSDRENTTTTAFSGGNTSTIQSGYAPGVSVGPIACDYQGQNCGFSGTASIPIGEATSKTYTDFTGVPLKQEQTTYEWQVNSAYYNANLLDIPSQTKVLSGGLQQALTSYSYDESAYSPGGVRGNPTTTTRWLNTGTSPTTHTGWNAMGMRSFVIDADNNLNGNGHTIDYGYTNSAAGCYGAAVTGTTNALNQQTSGTYDPKTCLLLTYKDPNLEQTSLSYDSMRRLICAEYPDGGSTAFNIDDSARTVDKVVRLNGGNACQSNANNIDQQYQFDGFGRQIESSLLSDPAGADITRTTYDSDGRVASVTNPFRSTTESTYGITGFSYDALNRKITETEPDGATKQWCFDAYTGYGQPNCRSRASSVKGEWVDSSDEVGNDTQSVTDMLGRLTSVVEPNGTIPAPSMETDYSYDPLNNLLEVDQYGGAKGNSSYTDRERLFTYDSLSRLIQGYNPEVGWVCYGSTGGAMPNGANCSSGYDLNGNLAVKTDQRGIAVNYSFDKLNRLLGKTYSVPTPAPSGYAPTAPASYSYDQVTSGGNQIGRRSGMTDSAGQQTWRYDAMGRIRYISRSILTPQSNQSDQAEYSYTPAGGMNLGTFYTGTSFQYSYDGAGRQTGVSWVASSTYPQASGATYSASGLLTGLTQGGTNSNIGYTVTTTDAYNNRLQPVVLSAGTSAQTVLSHTYCYASCYGGAPTQNNGNILEDVDNLTSANTATYQFDTLNRLKSGQTAQTWGDAYTYDPFGSLYQITPIGNGVGQNLQAQPSAQNQLLNVGLLYDAAGNVLQDNLGTRYTYDAEGRIATAGSWSYTYDGDGRRVLKTAGGNSGDTYWYGADGTLSDEQSVGLNPTYGWPGELNHMFYLNGRMIENGGFPANTIAGDYFVLYDQIGSTRTTFDVKTGNVNNTNYYPFGGFLSAPTDDIEQRFTGKERDTESGNDYFGARYYASSMGRWLSPDWSSKASPVPFATFGDPQSLNLYSYVRNNPLTNSDADGHCDIGCAFSIAWGVFHGIQRDGGVGNYSRNLGIGVLKGAGSAVVNTLKLAAAGTNPGAIAAAVLSPGPKALQPSNTTQAQASIATQIAGPAVVGMAAGPLLGAAGAGESAASGLPATVARAIPASIDATTLGAPGASDVFVTSGGALNGMTSSQISSGLTIPESSSGFNIFEFPTPDGIASPINRTNPGFVGGGQTAGGLPEYVVPNGPIPANATKTFVPPSQ